jgi:hypothetical protein
MSSSNWRWKILEVRSFHSGNPGMSMSCLTCTQCLSSCGYAMAGNLTCHWQTHLPDAIADNTSLYPSAVPKRNWRELCRDSDLCSQLGSSLVRAPNIWPGHEFESSCGLLSVLTEGGRTLGVRSFHISMNTVQKMSMSFIDVPWRFWNGQKMNPNWLVWFRALIEDNYIFQASTQ